MKPDLLAYLDDDERELLRLAEKATPAPWTLRHEKHYDVIWDTNGFRVCGNVKRADASYIAAANPAATIALLTALAEARAEVRTLREAFAGCVLAEAARLSKGSAWMLAEMARRESAARIATGWEVAP